MLIQCTKKLLDKLGLSSSEVVSVRSEVDGTEAFYSWHANLITINRCKAIVLMNNLTRYTIVLYRPGKRDLLCLGERIREGIRAAFAEEGIKENVIEEYLSRLGEAEITKTGSQSTVANLNEMCRMIGYFSEYLDENQVVQNNISRHAGRYIVKFAGEYQYPNEQLFRALCSMMAVPPEAWENVLAIESYQLKIKIALEKFDVWRRILIPSQCTFAELHKVIQCVFGWFDYHLHEFEVKEGTDFTCAENLFAAYPTKIRIVDGNNPEVEEFLEPDRYEIRFDTKTKLKDIFGGVVSCLYTYDFGDNWTHIINLEKVTRDGISRSPVLLEQQGERPPEDVGGEGGFEEYMRIISDETDPEYESMISWSEITRERRRSIEDINFSLSRLMS